MTSHSDKPRKAKTWTLSIPEAFPSANVYLRLHWSKRRKLADAWSWLLLAAGVAAIPRASKRRRVVVTRIAPRKIDPANLYLSADKLALDNLVKAGVLVNDSERWLELKVRQRVGKASTTIEISEARA